MNTFMHWVIVGAALVFGVVLGVALLRLIGADLTF